MNKKWLLAGIGVGLLLTTLLKSKAQPVPAEKRGRWKRGFAQVNGLKLHYVEAGEGQVVLFLHGFPEFWYAWKEQLPYFGKRYRAVAVDMRGYNLSDKPANVDDYAVPLLIADVKALLEWFSPGKKAVVVAHDWGGVVAWAFAARHPEMLEKLVIVNAPHPAVFLRELRHNEAQQKASRYMNVFRGATAETVLSVMDFAALRKAVFGSSEKPDSFAKEDRDAYLAAWSRPGALTGGLNYYRAARLGPPSPTDRKADTLPDTPLTNLPPDVPVPTLVIWGEKDTALLTGNLDGLDKYVPGLTIRRVPDGGHWVVHEQPELVNRTIEAFLNRE